MYADLSFGKKMATGSGHSSGTSKRPPAKPVRYKLLSTCTLGGHELRFLSMNEANGAVSFPVTVEEVIIFSSVKSATFPGQNGGFEQFKIRIYANAWNLIKFLLIFPVITISGIILYNILLFTSNNKTVKLDPKCSIL